MFGERANRVLGSVGNRSRFFTATLFLLSTFATSVWTDNSTGSIGECAFFGYPGGILSAPCGGQNRIFVSHIFHFVHVYYLLVYMKISSISFISIFSPSISIHPYKLWISRLKEKKSFPVDVSLRLVVVIKGYQRLR